MARERDTYVSVRKIAGSGYYLEKFRAAYYRSKHRYELYKSAPEGYGNKPVGCVMSLYGDCGAGKSSVIREVLMKELDSLSSAAIYVSYDFDIDGTGKLEFCLKLRDRLLEKDVSMRFPDFEAGLYCYCRKSEKSRSMPGAARVFGNETVKELFAAEQSGAAYTSDTVSKGNTPEKRISEGGYSDLSAVKMLDLLPGLLADDLNVIFGDSSEPLVIFLDSCEKLADGPVPSAERFNSDTWLRNTEGAPVSGLIHRIKNAVWVIAGRNELKWETSSEAARAYWEDSLFMYRVGPLTEEDSISYLMESGISDRDMCGKLYALTGGVPLYLELCAGINEEFVKEGKTPAIDDFGETPEGVTGKYIAAFGTDIQTVLFVLSIHGNWNRETAGEIFSRTGLSYLAGEDMTAYEKAMELFFIEKRSGCYYSRGLHGTVRGLIIGCCAGLPRETALRTAGELIKYYSEKLERCCRLSAEYNICLTRLAELGALMYEGDELIAYFNGHVLEGYNNLLDTLRLDAAELLIGYLSESAGTESEGTLYRFVQKLKNETEEKRAEHTDDDFFSYSDIGAEYSEYIKANESKGPDDSGTVSRYISYGRELAFVFDGSLLSDIYYDIYDMKCRLYGEDSEETLDVLAQILVYTYHCSENEDCDITEYNFDSSRAEKKVLESLASPVYSQRFLSDGAAQRVLAEKDCGLCERLLRELVGKNDGSKERYMAGLDHIADLYVLSKDLTKALELVDLLYAQGYGFSYTFDEFIRASFLFGEDDELLDMLDYKLNSLDGEIMPECIWLRIKLFQIFLNTERYGYISLYMSFNTGFCKAMEHFLVYDGDDEAFAEKYRIKLRRADDGRVFKQLISDYNAQMSGEGFDSKKYIGTGIGMPYPYISGAKRLDEYYKDIYLFAMRQCSEDETVYTAIHEWARAGFYFDRGDEFTEKWLDMFDRVYESGFHRLDALNNMGALLFGMGRFEEAAEKFEEAYKEAKELRDNSDDSTENTFINNAAAALCFDGQYEEILKRSYHEYAQSDRTDFYMRDMLRLIMLAANKKIGIRNIFAPLKDGDISEDDIIANDRDLNAMISEAGELSKSYHDIISFDDWDDELFGDLPF